MTRMQRKNFRKGFLFILPWLVGFAIFTVYPIVASFYFSFTEYHVTKPPVWVGLENYRKLFKDVLFTKSLANTLYYAAGLVPIGLVVGLFLALLLVQPLKEIVLYRGVIYFPSIVPAYAFATVGIWFFHPYLGFVNYILSFFGIDGPMWLSDEKWAKFTIILLAQWGAGGTALIYMAAIKDIPKELYEAAILDGATRWQMFRKITLPLISPATLYYLVTATLAALQIFDLPQIMTGGGPANSTLSYVMYLYRHAFSYVNMGYASAMAWILFLISAFFTFLIFKTSRRWVFYYGSKR
ncbi:MAG: sugar ABC transporter permease [Thermotoga sp.]|nr:MAG: sugar ABC transporter permease [Thermotoga sp.]HDM69846.1 sugar ABC transporter permease [Thermotogales bacterium]